MVVGPGVTGEHIAAAQEAMGRTPGAAGSPQAALIEDMRTGNAQAGLEKAAMQTPSFPAIRNLADNNIGYRDNQGNVQRPANEAQRYQDVNQRLNLLESFVNNGFAGMAPADQQTLVAEVSNAILNSTDMASRFAGLTAAQRTTEVAQMADAYLRDPASRNRVVELVLTRADLTKPINDQVTEVNVKLDELRAEHNRLTQAGGEQPVAQQAENDAQAKLRLYQEDPNPPQNGNPNHGRFYNELQAEIQNRNNFRTQIDNLENVVIPGQESAVQNLRNDLQTVMNIENNYVPSRHPNPAYDPNNQVAGVAQYLDVDGYLQSRGLQNSMAIRQQIQQSEQQIRTDRNTLSTRKGNLADTESKITRLNEEKARAEQALKDAQQKRKEADDKVAKLTKDINEQQAKFNKLHGEKELQESEWVRQIMNIVTDMAAEKVHEELPRVAELAKTRMEKAAADAKTNNEKRFLDRLSKRYFDGRFEPQRQNIDGDFTWLMLSGRDLVFTIPDNTPGAAAGATRNVNVFLDGSGLALARALGFADVIPGETPAARATRMQRIYEQVNSAEFRQSMAPKVALEILTARLVTGHLSRREVLAIEKSPWGPGMVAQALEGKTNLQAAVDKLVGKGVLNWGDNLMEQLKKIEWSKFAMILLILAGVIGGVSLLKKG